MKNVRLSMLDEVLIDKEEITSFLNECLIWNVSNNKITQGYSWSGKFQNAIAFCGKRLRMAGIRSRER